MDTVKQSSRVAVIVLASVSELLVIIASALTNWSHLNAGEIDLPYIINFGPWRICTKPKGFSNKCESLTSKYVDKLDHSGDFTVAEFKLSKKEWQEVQVVRAFTIMAILLVGFAIIALALTFFMSKLRDTLEANAYRVVFVSAFFGFLATCVWADVNEKNNFQYGASYVVHLVSWLILVAAGLVGRWGIGNGVPEAVTRHTALVVSLLLVVLSILATALRDWGHGETPHYPVPDAGPLYVSDTTYGLWKLCTKDAGTLSESLTCLKYGKTVNVPNPSGNAVFAKTISFKGSELSKLHAVQAMTILSVLAAAAAFAIVLYTRFAAEPRPMVVRLRTAFVGVIAFCSFIAMCTYAGFINGRSTPDYGSAFGVNCVVWVVALLWFVSLVRSGPEAAAKGSSYVVTQGEGVTPSPYASV